MRSVAFRSRARPARRPPATPGSPPCPSPCFRGHDWSILLLSPACLHVLFGVVPPVVLLAASSFLLLLLHCCIARRAAPALPVAFRRAALPTARCVIVCSPVCCCASENATHGAHLACLADLACCFWVLVAVSCSPLWNQVTQVLRSPIPLPGSALPVVRSAQLCPAGSFSNTPGQAACLLCPAGTSSNLKGQTQVRVLAALLHEFQFHA